MDNSYVRPTYSRPGCRCALTGRGARTPGRRPTKGIRCPRCVSSSGPLSCCRSHCRRWHGLARCPSCQCRLLTTVVNVCPLLHSSPGSRLKQQWTSVWFYSHKSKLRNSNKNDVTSNTHIYTLEWPHFTWWVNNFWNQQRIRAKTITLGAKSIERNRRLTAPKQLSHSDTFKNLSIWQSHVFNSEPINALSYECFGWFRRIRS